MTGRWLDQLTLAAKRGLARSVWLRQAIEHTRSTMQITHRKLMDVIRDTRKTMYVVAAFYVAVGFLVAIVSLATGTLLGTFLGFLIISGTLAAATVLRAVLRTDLHVSGINDALVRQSDRLDRIEHAITRTHDATERRTVAGSSGDGVVDVATGDACPSAITAGTLDHDAFPRLASLLEREALVAPLGSGSLPNDEAPVSFPPEHANPSGDDGDEPLKGGPVIESGTAKNVLRVWKRALREGDLASARGAFSALLETCDRASVDGMRAELVELARRTERSLRRAVSDCVTHRDLDGLVAVMQEIRNQLPEHPLASECARLEPVLRRHASDQARRDRQGHETPSDPFDDDNPPASDGPARLFVARSAR